jgi:hypothetical protein
MSEKGNLYSDKDRQTISDFAVVFDSDAGKRVLAWMEQAFWVKITVEPEEQLNRQLENNGEMVRVPIDPVAMVKRQGMRAAYYKVLAMVDEAQALINREAVSNNE